jgi:ATP-dependent Lon protease
MSEKDEIFASATPRGGEPELRIPEILPVLPLENIVFYPSMMAPLQVTGKSSITMINEALSGEKILALVAQSTEDVEEPTFSDLYRFGTAAVILKMLTAPDGSVMVLMKGIARVKLVEPVQAHPYLKGRIQVLEENGEKSERIEALQRNLANQFQKLISLVPHLPDELKMMVVSIDDPGKLADMVPAYVRVPLGERQAILETVDIERRLERVTSLLNRELSILELGSKIQDQVQSELSKKQREYYLREEMKAIQRELGDADRESMEIEELRQKIQAADLPERALSEATRELSRLEQMAPGSAEYSVARTYLDWILALPWNESGEDTLDIAAADRVLEKVKERILEYLSVRKLKQDLKGPILCFVGPPGVGKTSLGKSIARALGRKFVRVSLGGMRDEAEIRGHRRTYIGALPGKIIQGLRNAGSKRPVFMLDEVDKLGADFRGDPSSALLEVLDPEQNVAFVDHYLDLPFDLSQVMFIGTANILDPVPPALRDRMEVLQLSGYTLEEKLEIAKRYLIPKQLNQHGLTPSQIRFDSAALRHIITEYTREAGLRNLEREIATICRKVARRVAEGKRARAKIAKNSLSDYLGPIRFYTETAQRLRNPGVATGLAWTAAGGDLLFLEAIQMKGKGQLQLTGQLGEVMKESAHAALSYIRSKAAEYGISEETFADSDIHIHVPAGAIPKDGPSAGLPLSLSILSLLTGRRISGDLAFTGEITLQGRILPVGGIKEKILAARRAGIRRVILPEQNRRDVEEIKPEFLGDLQLDFVKHFDEAAEIAIQDGKAASAKSRAAKKGARKKAAQARPASRKAKSVTQ